MTDGRFWQFTLAGFAIAVSTVGVGTAAVLAFVPLVGSYLGMLAGGFVAGLAIERRPLPEAGVAAVLSNLGILLVGALDGNGVVAALSALVSLPPLSLATASVLSFAVGAFGAHFGDDLRDGLTTPVETQPSSDSTTDRIRAPSTHDEVSETAGTIHDERERHDEVLEPEETSVNPAESGELELERE